MKINSSEYWNRRFSSGDWEEKKGRQQTLAFAKEQVARFDIPNSFSGKILDFGCGLGDAMPIYKQKYPNAKLIGVDHSKQGIKKCCQKYAHLATFIVGSSEDIPTVDTIISSNVFEHLSNDVLVAEALLRKCKKLFIIVPYKEPVGRILEHEHINSYDDDSFASLPCLRKVVYKSAGLGSLTWMAILYQVWFKNIFRLLKRGKVSKYKAPQEIMFEFQGKL
jgi:ubiquinone/menaquinone biosynthesis C-methylase UbiE